MGMSASQARFLILTAQKNNNEYQAQRITHERLVLAQNVDGWTNEYNEKMSNKTLLFNPNTAADVDLYNYNNRLTYKDIIRSSLDQTNPGIGARLTTSSGKTIVPSMPSEAEIQRYNGKTVMSQANYDLKAAELRNYYSSAEGGSLVDTDDNKALSAAVTQALESYWVNTENENQETLEGYTNSVFKGLSEEDFFVDPSIEDPVALQMALTNGVYFISMNQVDPYNPDKGSSWEEVNYANNAQTGIMEVLDKTDDAAAQAEYDRKNSSFHQKDKMLEMRLKQLESEHKALETEMESVKKVIQEDVESSFKTFG